MWPAIGQRGWAMRDASAPDLVQVDGLKMYFPVYSGVLRRHSGDIKAVDDVSFTIRAGETLGLVGESGCGKSTLGRAMLRLYDPTAGRVVIDGEDIARLSPEALRKKRPTMQMVFQDPQASLNPRMSLSSIIGEPLVEHTALTTAQRQDRIYELMDQVGLNRRFANRFPHEFSGGQRQRIGIARALYHDPAVLVLDEATSALDTDTERSVMQAVRALHGTKTILIVAHRLSTVEHCDRLYRLEQGRVAAEGSPDAMLQQQPGSSAQAQA